MENCCNLDLKSGPGYGGGGQTRASPTETESLVNVRQFEYIDAIISPAERKGEL